MKKFFIQIICLAIASMCICNVSGLNGNFFSDPGTLTSNEVLAQLDSKSLDMCWQCGPESFFRFMTKKDEVYFEIIFDKIPCSYQKEVQDLFILKSGYLEGEQKEYYIFSYESDLAGQETVNQPREKEKIRGSNHSTYLVDERRIFEKSCPQSIGVDELASIICNHKVLFYTGAGLSVASGVPSMAQLNSLLDLGEGERFVDSLQDILKQPATFAKNAYKFHEACFFSPPSPAHEALRRLAIYKNVKIVTENLDTLHERSGILPYRINAEELRKDVGSEQVAKIDYIICVGLRYDDRGFLGWYKRANPNGRIIAIDLGVPSYLGDEDFIVNGDLQVLVPALAAKVLGE